MASITVRWDSGLVSKFPSKLALKAVALFTGGAYEVITEEEEYEAEKD
jgi:hypothetical protein